MLKIVQAIALCTLAFCGSSRAFAASTVDANTETFLNQSAAGNMGEQDIGRLAAKQASRAEVRNFAQMVADDHAKLQGDLTDLAGRLGVTLPTEASPATKDLKAQLDKKSGIEFDRAFL